MQRSAIDFLDTTTFFVRLSFLLINKRLHIMAQLVWLHCLADTNDTAPAEAAFVIIGPQPHDVLWHDSPWSFLTIFLDLRATCRRSNLPVNVLHVL